MTDPYPTLMDALRQCYGLASDGDEYQINAETWAALTPDEAAQKAIDQVRELRQYCDEFAW